MPSVFVDANILLGFWGLQDGRIPSELLLPLVELGNKILITQQIVDEVNRNKLNVFLRDCGKINTNFRPLIPDHMVDRRGFADWNEKIRQQKSSSRNTEDYWRNEIVPSIARQISDGTDIVTRMLSPLFQSPSRPTAKQLEAARERKERGNPPGKRSDPLGDQISWEQFLDAVKGEKRVWILTRDSDYAVAVNKDQLLNPFLASDLKSRGVEQVEVHDNIAGALRSIQASGVHFEPALDEEKLVALQNEEEEAQYPQPPYGIWPDSAWLCPKCHAVNQGGGLSAHPSQYGGWSYWAHCARCGYRWDTGEPYDE